ncbi:MAG: hypothetical protein FJX73_09795 [Armatimonadetes bacterium]|nr:hypothetical protein [Armatimonadota bacterium]
MAVLRVPSLLVLALVSGGCLLVAPRPEVRPGAFAERTVVLLVEGTPGLAFEASYRTPAQSTSAQGTVPAQFVLKTRVGLAATFTKTAAEGELVVRVLVDDQEVLRRSTSAPFGTIIITRSFSP